MGPIQLLVVGFDGVDFEGKIATELDRLRANDTIRLLDVVVVLKDEGARVRFAESRDGDARSLARRLIDGEGDDLSHLETAEPEDLWAVADAIPPGSAAGVAVLEHRWAIPLRDAIEQAGGTALLDAWIAPEDLASLGLTA